MPLFPVKSWCGGAGSRHATALIGIGGNLPGPDGGSALDTCRRAVVMLDGLPGLQLVGLSRWFVSAPVPASDQPDYVNAVAVLMVRQAQGIDPALLLSRLMAVEAACGRVRASPNGARTLDLDLIGMDGPGGQVVRSAPDPILPHPRAHLRAFVLAPLAEVAPGWVHPLLGRSAAELLAGLGPQEIRAL